MTQLWYIVWALALAVAVLIVTGWWRLAFVAFAIRPSRMTVDRLGLLVTSPADVDRVDTILASFAGGFNAIIAAPSKRAWRAYCDSLPALYRPFAYEGAAMGYTLRHLFRYRPDEFEDRIVKPVPEYRYLSYVGLGFWSGMRRHDATAISRVVEGLDLMHRYLCYDGYGFKHAFFDYPSDPDGLRPLELLKGYARNAAYQGVGRAFFFLYMADPERLVEQVGKLGAYAADAAGGVGLAAAFINPDRLEVARELGGRLPPDWHDHYHLGLCFGLKARSINDVDQFEQDMDRTDAGVREAVLASIRECDRVELLTRSEQEEDGYRRWRERVTEWMADHIRYPLSGLRSATPDTVTAASTPT